MNKFIRQFVSSVLIAVLLAGCGFQLREAYQLPEKYSPVGIDSPRVYRDLGLILKQELERSSVILSDNTNSANLVIRLQDVSETEELLTASATGSPLERELILNATVFWEDREGTDVVDSENFTLRRTYVYDERAVLSKRREADRLMRDLERELARRIILRMRQID
ncbi:MAG: hypothetical protein KJO88_06910 [Gammaproteobacteria bacterium]|nr:hypothetical protein [Gammaproteobacteria bacterium]